MSEWIHSFCETQNVKYHLGLENLSLESLHVQHEHFIAPSPIPPDYQPPRAETHTQQFMLQPLFSLTHLFLCSGHVTSPSPYGTPLSNMNKVHGNISKLPSVNQIVAHQSHQNAGPSASMVHMGTSLDDIQTAQLSLCRFLERIAGFWWTEVKAKSNRIEMFTFWARNLITACLIYLILAHYWILTSKSYIRRSDHHITLIHNSIWIYTNASNNCEANFKALYQIKLGLNQNSGF